MYYYFAESLVKLTDWKLLFIFLTFMLKGGWKKTSHTSHISLDEPEAPLKLKITCLYTFLQIVLFARAFSRGIIRNLALVKRPLHHCNEPCTRSDSFVSRRGCTHIKIWAEIHHVTLLLCVISVLTAVWIRVWYQGNLHVSVYMPCLVSLSRLMIISPVTLKLRPTSSTMLAVIGPSVAAIINTGRESEWMWRALPKNKYNGSEALRQWVPWTNESRAKSPRLV